jgi:predicted permease
MSLWRRLKCLWPAYRRAEERDMQEELDSLRRMAAPNELGNLTIVAENTRAAWTLIRIEQLLQDVRYALRALRRNPAFAAVVIVTLALGIGLNTAVFSVVNAALLRPLSYADSERLLWMTKYRGRINEELVPHREFQGWREQASSFDRMAAYSVRDEPIATSDSVIQGRIVSVSDDFWSISGARPALGRLPQPGEPDVLLTHSLFDRLFGGDPNIVGKTIFIQQDRRQVTIAGVLPQEFLFEFPLPDLESAFGVTGIDAYQTEILRPRGYAAGVVGKVKPEMSIDRVRAELEAISARIDYVRPEEREADLRLMPLLEKRIGHARTALWVLLAAVVFVLLIACANIANLLLARSSTRHKEIAIRASIGAGRLRVLRQFLVESTLLVVLGGVLGLLFARWGLAFMVGLSPAAVPRLEEAGIDARVLAFAFGMSVLTAIAFGFAPAVVLWKAKLHDVLKDSSRTASASSRSLSARKVLVAVELALAVLLLTGAGLMVKSFWRMNAHPPGFEPDQILIMRFTLSGPQYFRFPERPRAYIDELLRQVQLIPGVEAAGVLKEMTGDVEWEGAAPRLPVENPPRNRVASVSQGYARVMGLRLLRGRWVSDTDTEPAIVINESLARRDFPGQDPIGRRTTWGGTVVGIAGDLKRSRLDAAPAPELYRTYRASSRLDGDGMLLVRTTGDPLEVAPMIRNIANGIDKSQPTFGVMTLEQALSDSVSPRRFSLLLLGTFAAVALLLAVIGIYGVIAFSVAQRTHEIGVRMALGADRREVVGMILRQGMVTAGAGILAGLGAALALTRIMTSMLYDVEPTDLVTFAAVAVALSLTALAACWLPALKAALVDPLNALRHE